MRAWVANVGSLGTRKRGKRAYLVVDVVCPGAAEEVLQGAVIGWELVFLELVVCNDTCLAQLGFFIKRCLERVGMLALCRRRSRRCWDVLFIFMATSLKLFAWRFVEVDGFEVRAVVALPLVFERALLALERCAVVAKAWHGAAAFAVPVELSPDRVECASLEHQKFLVAAILPGHAAEYSRVEVNAHTNTAVEEVGGERRVGGEGHDGSVVVAGVRVRSPSLGKCVLLGQE